MTHFIEHSETTAAKAFTNEHLLSDKEALLQQRTQIQMELDRLRASIRTQVDIDPDEGDAEIAEREKDVMLISILDRSLDNISKALRAIDLGRYGICERCDAPIPAERLEAKPDATLCISCQQTTERLIRLGRNNIPMSTTKKVQLRRSRQQGEQWADEIQDQN